MLQLTDTALLAISTPLDEFNYYSKLVEQKDENGDPFFHTVKAGAACDDCMRLSHKEMLKCTHVVNDQHWKNPHKLKRLKILYEGDEARGVREMVGAAASSFSPCFEAKDIEQLFSLPPIRPLAMPDAIYMCVDPNGGGPSTMGCVSGYYDGNTRVVSHPLFILLFLYRCPFLARCPSSRISLGAFT